jgi:hypothetical protein
MRQTDRDVALLAGAQPKSMFQLVGTGQVGPGSIRGIPMLRRLRVQGFSIWPFDAYSTPLLVEIYPRVFTGKVIKSSSVARQHYLSLLGTVPPCLAAAAAASEHAFDAACSALAMGREVETLRQLEVEPPPYDIEGKMFVATPLRGLVTDPGQARPDPLPVATRRTRLSLRSSDHAAADAGMPSPERPMVRVMRTSATGLDEVPSEELQERIAKLQRLVADPT